MIKILIIIVSFCSTVFSLDAPFNGDKRKRSYDEQLQVGKKAKLSLQISEYSINIMWVFNELSGTENLVFPEKHEKTLLKENILAWAEKNKNASINYWYDSNFVSPEQIHNTKKLFVEWNKQLGRKPAYQINLRDLRQIAKVHKKMDVFSNATPIYFRVDLLRILATIDTLKNSPINSVFVYADMDIVPMDESELFDKETMKKIERFGIVFMKKTGCLFNMENGFHIISNNNKNLLKAIKAYLINLNILRAKEVIAERFQAPSPKESLKEIVYESIPLMFECFYNMENLGALKIINDINEYVAYDKEFDELPDFDPRIGPATLERIVQFVPKDLSIIEEEEHAETNNQIIIPTKKVKMNSKIKGIY